MVTLKQKLNPIWWFGNIDDPEPCSIDWYVKEQCNNKCNLLCKLKWFFIRNPLHNFMFYVVGVEDKIESKKCKYVGKMWGGYKKWNFAYVKCKYFILPFVSYNGNFQFYIGWRGKGNFGIAFRKNHDFDRK